MTPVSAKQAIVSNDEEDALGQMNVRGEIRNELPRARKMPMAVEPLSIASSLGGDEDMLPGKGSREFHRLGARLSEIILGGQDGLVNTMGLDFIHFGTEYAVNL